MGSKPDGLFRLTERVGGFRVEHFDCPPCSSVYDICPDREGRLWLATMGGGLCRIDHPEEAYPSVTGMRTDPAYPPMKEHRVRRLHWTADGILLATTTEGLLVMKDGHFRLHRREADRANSLSCNATMDVLEDARHRIWVSTESGGVNEVLTADLMAERLEFRHHDVSSGMNSDIALALAENRGELWIVGSNRLMTWEPERQVAGYFDSHFFRRSMRFSEAGPLHLPDGRWLFGLEDGAFTLTGDRMKKDAYRPPLVLTGIALPGQPVRRAVSRLRELRLRPHERSLTVHFAALDYTEPAGISYAFRMEDETEWNHIGKNRSVSFWNLAPGTYRLQLRSTNADGVWVDNVRTLMLVVEARFFETWAGRLLLALLGMALLGGILYTFIYIRRIKRQQRETLEAYLDILSRIPDEKETPPSTVVPDAIQPPAVELSEDDRLFMQRVMAFVEAHIDDAELGVNDMAEAAATSRSGLNRKLKSIVGLTPADFLREARIKQACRRLAETDASVSDIAYGCGFNDPKYFSKCFKNSVGHSPSDYRELVKKPSEPHLPPL
ncbi:MAG: helix-turn-helix domain-containing protein [Bacteroidaceae bacterium]